MHFSDSYKGLKHFDYGGGRTKLIFLGEEKRGELIVGKLFLPIRFLKNRMELLLKCVYCSNYIKITLSYLDIDVLIYLKHQRRR